MKERAYGRDHINVADSLAVLGTVKAARSEFERAEAIYARALGIWELNPPIDELRMAETLANMALLRQAQQRNGEAIALYDEAIAVFTRNVGPRDRNTLRARYNQASAFAAQHVTTARRFASIGKCSRRMRRPEGRRIPSSRAH